MKSNAIECLNRKLSEDEPVFGLWVTLESASITEMAVALGLDWVVIDAEHGHLDWHDVLEHVRATVRSDTVALVRVAELNGGLIKRALDIGADGVVIPWIETVEQLQQAVAFANYPPAGLRGIGGERATGWGACLLEHTIEANEHVLVVPLIETVKGRQNIDQLCQVAGANLFYLGPADYSASAGYAGQWEGPGVAEQLLAIKDAVRAAGKHCGVVTTGPTNLTERQDQGFRMLGLGLDGPLMLGAIKSMLAAVDRDQAITTSFDGQGEPVLLTPPSDYRPDRGEVMTNAGSGQKAQVTDGVEIDCHVGKQHNDARNLTTGIVTFAAGARLAYHSHPFTESVTLLKGQVVLEVEGRRYKLKPLDNVVIRAGLAHTSHNPTGSEPALLHIAMATEEIVATPVDRSFDPKEMPADAECPPNKERVNRHDPRKLESFGPGVRAIHYFNESLMPGIEMSGGYARFRPNGRLPAHIHNYDESICIIEGTATCIVEGNAHALSGNATAMVPRGRVHYFKNDTHEPMAMVWVYAGPSPERIVVRESCATAEGSPWGR